MKPVLELAARLEGEVDRGLTISEMQLHDFPCSERVALALLRQAYAHGYWRGMEARTDDAVDQDATVDAGRQVAALMHARLPTAP